MQKQLFTRKIKKRHSRQSKYSEIWFWYFTYYFMLAYIDFIIFNIWYSTPLLVYLKTILGDFFQLCQKPFDYLQNCRLFLFKTFNGAIYFLWCNWTIKFKVSRLSVLVGVKSWSEQVFLSEEDNSLKLSLKFKIIGQYKGIYSRWRKKWYNFFWILLV